VMTKKEREISLPTFFVRISCRESLISESK
jgi:hypothetical protein